MKRVSFLAALLLLISALTVRAEIIDSGFCGADPNLNGYTVEYGENLSWTLTDDGVFTISGSGRMCDKYEDLGDGVFLIGYPWEGKKGLIRTVVIGEGVTYIGTYAFEDCDVLDSVSIPSSVTEIGDYAFSGCTSLDGVVIPQSVTVIGDGAFYGCTSLSEIVIPESITAILSYTFFNCSSLTEVTIPSYITEIGEHAFCDCTSLSEIVIPESVTSIGRYAFAGCPFASVSIPENITSIPEGAFNFCTSLTELTIPSSVTEIGELAFGNCTSLSEIVIPESIMSIGKGAFYGCSGLTSVLIPAGVRIKDSPFSYHDRIYPFTNVVYGQYPLLESLIIRSGINYDGQIFDFAASPLLHYLEVPADVLNDGRDDVDSIQLPVDTAIIFLYDTLDYRGFEFLKLCRNTLRYIDLSATENRELPAEALSNCFMAETILLPENLERIDSSAFSGCKSLKSIDIPASVTEIDDSAFKDCISLSSINFGGTEGATAEAGRAAAPAAQSELRRIGNWAFYNCHQLQHLVIPEGVTEIGDAAFYGCTYLEDLELPSTVTSIGDNCFALCSKLKQIRVRAAVPPEIEAKTFFDVNREIPVYVPEDYLDDYREDPYWREFNLIGEEQGGTVGTDHAEIAELYRMEDGRIVLTEEMPVSVYSVTGALIYSGTATEVPLPVPGVYLLRIGGETVKVVRP